MTQLINGVCKIIVFTDRTLRADYDLLVVKNLWQVKSQCVMVKTKTFSNAVFRL